MLIHVVLSGHSFAASNVYRNTAGEAEEKASRKSHTSTCIRTVFALWRAPFDVYPGRTYSDNACCYTIQGNGSQRIVRILTWGTTERTNLVFRM